MSWPDRAEAQAQRQQEDGVHGQQREAAWVAPCGRAGAWQWAWDTKSLALRTGQALEPPAPQCAQL